MRIFIQRAANRPGPINSWNNDKELPRMANGHGGRRPGAGRPPGTGQKQRAARDVISSVSARLAKEITPEVAAMTAKEVVQMAYKVKMAAYLRTEDPELLNDAVRYAREAMPFESPKLTNVQMDVDHSVTKLEAMSDDQLLAIVSQQPAVSPLLTVSAPEPMALPEPPKDA